MAAIEFDHITKRFPDGTVAVDDLELTVADGEFMIFVGPSGCGKTTALRMVAGLEEITSGEIRIGGRIVNHLEPPDRDIAMVFQNYALYPHMSVEDNIGFPLRMQRLKKAETSDRVREVAELLGIGDLLRRKPRELSGGQRQRVAMGRAIIRHPQAFLMDEPLSNLDAKLRVQMRAELVKLHRRLARDRSADRDALALATGELLRLPLQQLTDREHLGDLGHAPVDLLLWHAAELQTEGDVVVDAHVGIEGVVLEDHGDVAIRRLEVVDDPSSDTDLPGRDLLEACDHA